MKNKRIILVDDDELIRAGLREIIQKLGPYEVVAEYDNGRQLLNAMATIQDIDLIILDVNMPEMSGDETMQQLNEKGNTIPVLILTVSQEDARMVRQYRMGVRCYLQKNCKAKSMREALSEIFRCGYYHNEFLAYSLQHDQPKTKKTEQEQVLEEMTAREREFLKLVCHEEEYTYQQIAGLMNVKLRAVDGYRESLFQKFGIKSKTGLVLFVLKHRLFDLL